MELQLIPVVLAWLGGSFCIWVTVRGYNDVKKARAQHDELVAVIEKARAERKWEGQI